MPSVSFYMVSGESRVTNRLKRPIERGRAAFRRFPLPGKTFEKFVLNANEYPPPVKRQQKQVNHKDEKNRKGK